MVHTYQILSDKKCGFVATVVTDSAFEAQNLSISSTPYLRRKFGVVFESFYTGGMSFQISCSDRDILKRAVEMLMQET